MEPRHGRSAFTISFSNPNGFANQCTAIPAVSYSAAGSSQLDVLAPTRGCKRKWTELALGLGDTSSSDSSKQSMGTGCTVSSLKGSDDVSCMDYDISFKLSLGNEDTSKLHKQACGSKRTMEKPRLDLKLSLAPSQSDVTDADLIRSSAPQDMFVQPYLMSSVPTVDEGSTSARHPSGGMVVSFLNQAGISPNQLPPLNSHLVQGPACSAPTVLQLPKSSAATSSGFVRPQQRNGSTKICSEPGCAKGARGSSGRCIAHGGGRRCQKEGCNKGAEGRTIFCKAHGGGKRCERLGCTKSAEGRTDFCIAHGGGRRCSHDGCKRAARGRSGLCIKHGGGKRCQTLNCTKSAEGRSGMCIAHGGGRRCQYAGCGKGAQGSTNFCKAHGGGKRCTHPDCSKGAEGSTAFCKAHGGGKRCSADGCTKSVHGGTQFCVAHGGGKRCVVEGCGKSARGRTDRCVGHGGGKRCHSAGCGKSAQGSTDFCKSHGGGRRCSWGHPGSDLGSGGAPCDRLARGKKGLCDRHNPLVHDNSVHGGASFGGFSVVSAAALSEGDGSPSPGTETSMRSFFMHAVEAPRCVAASAHEGRVHGGNFMPIMLDGGVGLGKRPADNADAGASAPPRSWKSMEKACGSAPRSWL
ncbi:uncharacterized protein [Zea mays]|jgi:hypothetical protein|uniref:WRKY19-like zinc finger domain-containing protein n=1 Tax=Zea mays TaxID=4577 RepID=C0PFN8_MAIZE|nr:uncharacterized protein LOC100383395 [Zea mays]XP_020409113.1 uncharacterized protein LOC100383395 isoform X1 [Zea mays]ACN34004.1 unknown [Zea mays]ACR38629.1 unknown [Zea mays]AQK70017.1 hypothetical protein ZEAMMB73_Zm00001d016075 [Zea mays]|eukprot:NP_001169521.1 uncharacterized protein LOC100383395 [Zea mays]